MNKNLKKIFSILFILIFLTINLAGCFDDEPSDDNGGDNGGSETKSEFELKVEKVNEKAVSWLETLDVDPIELRYEMGIKGKKKFVELLDSYLVLYQTTDNEAERTKYKNKVLEITNITNDPDYHDMNIINDTQFRQDSTSYLRAWYIMTQFNLNTTYYEQEIKKALPRIDDHLPRRGINQKMVFVFYYSQLGYPINYKIEELFNFSVIRERNEVKDLDELDVYFITHEVFVLFDDNRMLLLTDEDIEYLYQIIPYFVNQTISENNIDLLSELVMIMTYLGLYDLDDYKIALEYILANQNDNGSFGNYEYARKYYSDLGISVDIQLYLHTTEVTLRALNEAIDVFDEKSM
jgi:uncharacterized lipoprotein YehR (DUF1307 family)